MVSQAYPNQVVDGEWAHITPPWYEYGWVIQGMDPQTFTPLPPNQLNPSLLFPADQVMVQLNQYYFDADRNPLSGYLTFWPTSGFTITENNVSWYVPQRLCGTETWPGLDTGQSPWAWSMDTSGKIYTWLGLLTVILFATDNPNLSTDNGGPLAYQVTEHFQGGREYVIQVPSSGAGDLHSCIVPGTIRKHRFDPLSPIGVMGKLPHPRRKQQMHSFKISAESTEFITIDVAALGLTTLAANPTGDPVYMAFMQDDQSPQLSDWHTASWVSASPPYEITILIGPENGGVRLAEGRSQVYVMIVDNPTVPVRPVGWILVGA